MAMTINSRNVRRLRYDNKRVVEFDVSFSDGTAGTITKAQSGLKKVNEVLMKLKTAGGISLNLTANTDNTSFQVTPSGAASNVIIRVIGTE